MDYKGKTKQFIYLSIHPTTVYYLAIFFKISLASPLKNICNSFLLLCRGEVEGMNVFYLAYGLTQSRPSWSLQPDFCLCFVLLPHKPPLASSLHLCTHTYPLFFFLIPLPFISRYWVQSSPKTLSLYPLDRLCFRILGFVLTFSIHCITKRNIIYIILYQYLFLPQKKSSREKCGFYFIIDIIFPKNRQNKNKKSMSCHTFSL